MPSIAFANWRNDRTLRLNEVESHCAVVAGAAPPNPSFLDETLRGFVLHLSAHFQGFCRDLYAECSQIWIAGVPTSYQATAQAQFLSGLTLERSNPTYENIRKDFERFGFNLSLEAGRPTGPQEVTHLNHLNTWRNKAAHQAPGPLKPGIPAALSLPLVQDWKASCDGLAVALDAAMHAELLRVTGTAPW